MLETCYQPCPQNPEHKNGEKPFDKTASGSPNDSLSLIKLFEDTLQPLSLCLEITRHWSQCGLGPC